VHGIGPLLFVLFISDIDDGMVSKISKSADHTKTMQAMQGMVLEEYTGLTRNDLRRAYEWPNDRQMLFNVQK